MPDVLTRPERRLPRTAPTLVHAPRRRPWLLLGLEGLTALGAASGGANLMADGMGMDPALLAGTPLTSWHLPGLALIAVVCVPMAVAAAAEWRQAPRAAHRSLLAGVLLMAWIAVQVAVIGFQTWLQPAFFLVGLVVAGLARPRAEAIGPTDPARRARSIER